MSLGAMPFRAGINLTEWRGEPEKASRPFDALRSGDHSGWQERGLLDQIREFGIPITVFELDRAGRTPLSS